MSYFARLKGMRDVGIGSYYRRMRGEKLERVLNLGAKQFVCGECGGIFIDHGYMSEWHRETPLCANCQTEDQRHEEAVARFDTLVTR